MEASPGPVGAAVPLGYQSREDAVRLRPKRPLRPGWAHIAVWAGVATLVMGLALRACRDYNGVAGTKLTRGDMTKAVLSMNLGPFVGPVMRGSVDESFYGGLIIVAVP